MTIELCGQIIAGLVGKILIREKSGQRIELGDLLVCLLYTSDAADE